MNLQRDLAIVEASLATSKIRVFAKVRETERAFDFALTGCPDQASVVRVVDRVTQSDYFQLTTMLSEGNFSRAAIVYTAEDEPQLKGEIETYPLSRIHELAASLAGENAP